ncbi:hypothetical protein IQ07DRAFT_663093 [Pyrenochaeta sp. DS3sAY3a]|nr:hypothetical protein IQ07DRAFT_663093 [Pyrenochaeta sp. DS3sAY3a]
MAPARTDSPVDNESTVKSTKPTVYLLDTFHPTAVKHAQSLFNVILPSHPQHSEWREKAEYLLIRGSYLTAEDVAASPNLKAIGKQGVGIDKIDQAACRERGIKIFNTPGVNAQAVAETVLTLAMSVARQVGRITALQTAGEVVPKEKCSGLIISNKKIGIVGMGNIGQKVAKIFSGGLGAEIIAYDPLLPMDAWADIPHTRASTLEEVLQTSDIITLHIPLIPQTRNLIGYPQMQMMKRNAILINTARGGIVNEADLEQALKDELIFGAGLDCHEQEPPTKERYEGLWSTGRVVSTPHIDRGRSRELRNHIVVRPAASQEWFVGW